MELVHEINLGATAIGTGLNAPAGYAECARRHLAAITVLPLVTAANLVEATQDCGAFVQMSGAQADRREALQGLQRPAVAVVRAARGPERDQPAAGAGGFVHHAGEGQPGASSTSRPTCDGYRWA